MNVPISLDGLSVAVGMPTSRDISPLTVKSLLSTFTLCQKVGVPCQLVMPFGNAVIQWARDEVVDLFLKTDANRLFWIDSDMEWDPQDFMRMVALSQRREVICATYPVKTEPPTFVVHHEAGKVLEADEFGLLEIKGVGLGFTVMRREVVERLVAQAPMLYDEMSGRNIAEVFKVGAVDSNGRRSRRGEDMAFFDDIRGLGVKVLLDPQVDLGHIGVKKYTGTVRDALQLSP